MPAYTLIEGAIREKQNPIEPGVPWVGFNYKANGILTWAEAMAVLATLINPANWELHSYLKLTYTGEE